MANPLTYPTSRQPFSADVFENPPSEYRGAPFWAWVTKQEKETTVEQIEMFEKMGMGGFHMHTRVGLDIPYMGKEYMEIVKACVERAKEKGMHAFLYDEDRWPSGFAGGETLKDHPELKGLHLLFTPWPYGSDLPYSVSKFPVANAAPVRSELGSLLAIYAITLETGHLTSSRTITSASEAKPSEAVWYAYVEQNPPSEYMGDNTLPDLLRPDMTERFIEITHERYKSAVGKDFGQVVPSIFTDEPQYCPLQTLNSTSKVQDVFLPWTEGLIGSYKEKTGWDLKELLPKIIFDPKGIKANLPRYHLLDHLAELFATNYIGVLAKWCEKNGIICTGHMNAEPTLASQAGQTGEVMRQYRDMGLPGIDMLCDNFEFNTAKQASSVSRQFGRPGVMSELYGVTGWQFTFEGHKGQGDWQAAQGVTLRVPHLFWSTMRGEAKRDYPASIGYQSPWWEEYRTIEDHFSRVNAALTRGRPITRVAVIHPIESFWLAFGPKDVNGEEQVWRDQVHADLTKWLLLGHVDFDFISESLFPTQTSLESITEAKLPVGQCQYDVVILPNLRTVRATTLERLRKFTERGGQVIIAGQSPTLVDGKSMDRAALSPFKPVTFSKDSVLSALLPFRDIDMIVSDSTLYRVEGTRANSLMYQMRQDGEERFLFICNIDREDACPVDVTLKGEWRVEVLDTITGKSWELLALQADGETNFKWWFDGCESLLVHLIPRPLRVAAKAQTVLGRDFVQVGDVTLNSVTLSEPNSLLLDYATFKFGDGDWEPKEEVMRIDQLLRRRFGFYKKGAKIRQPHTISQEARRPIGELVLQFEFRSDITIKNASLAIEDAEQVGISFDGRPIPSIRTGWWVDRDISTVALPVITPGKHVLQLVYQYGPLTNLERVFILGDFGVRLRGRTAKIVELNLEEMEWGDITRQDLPFYTGNITYHCSFTPPTDNEDTVLRAAHFASPVIAVDVDGERKGLLIHQPRAINLGRLEVAEHRVDFTCFGNRHNAFGALHLVLNKTNYFSGDTWRTEYDWWSEEYILGQVGILNCPRVERPGREVLDLPRRPRKNDKY